MLLLEHVLHLVLPWRRVLLLHLVLHAQLVLLPLVLLLILVLPLDMLHLELLLEVELLRVTRRAYHGQHVVRYKTAATPASSTAAAAALVVTLTLSVLVSVQPTAAFCPLRRRGAHAADGTSLRTLRVRLTAAPAGGGERVWRSSGVQTTFQRATRGGGGGVG